MDFRGIDRAGDENFGPLEKPKQKGVSEEDKKIQGAVSNAFSGVGQAKMKFTATKGPVEKKTSSPISPEEKKTRDSWTKGMMDQPHTGDAELSSEIDMPKED